MMKNKYPIPHNEDSRLAALYQYKILDSEPEEQFDRISKLASIICNCPFSIINFIDKDRQWFKSNIGLPINSTERELSFCQYTIMNSTLLEIPDTLKDIRLKNNPFVTGDPKIRFYAGYPIIDPQGLNLGTVCVADITPKMLTEDQKLSLKLLAEEVASQVVNRLELEHRNRDILLIQEQQLILEKKEVEIQNQLTQQEKLIFDYYQLRYAVDQSVILVITDIKGTILKVNKKFCNVSKYAEEELIGQNHRILNSGHHDKSFFKEMWRTIALGKVWTGTIKNKAKDNSYYWVETTIIPILNEKGKPQQYIAIRQEVTELIFQQVRLLTQETEIKNQIQAINRSNATIEFDMNGTIIFTNDIFCNIMGYKQKEIIGKNHDIFLAPNSNEMNEQTLLWKKLNKGEFVQGEFINITKNGVQKWIYGNYNPIFNTVGVPYKVLKIAHDITEIKLKQIEIEKKNKELDEFAYIVSHDLKAPLRGITTLTEFIQEDIGDQLDENSKNNFKLIINRTKRLENLINDILSYSKIGRVKSQTEDVNINDLLNEILDQLIVPTHIKIIIKSKLPTLHIEKVFLFQIFSNLISNAIKYNKNQKGEINIGSIKNKKSIVFYVQDNGPGIDSLYHEKIFKLFQTIEKSNNPDSTGVGLSTVKKIIEELGGKIWLKSEIGLGTTFFIELDNKYISKNK